MPRADFDGISAGTVRCAWTDVGLGSWPQLLSPSDEARSRWSARSEARTNDLDGAERRTRISRMDRGRALGGRDRGVAGGPSIGWDPFAARLCSECDALCSIRVVDVATLMEKDLRPEAGGEPGRLLPATFIGTEESHRDQS